MHVSIPQTYRNSAAPKARSGAPAFRPRPLRPYVAAALHSERKRGRRGSTVPVWRKPETQKSIENPKDW